MLTINTGHAQDGFAARIRIVYIVLCWTYVPALVALGEGIRYLVLSKEEFARKAAVMKGPFAWLW